MRFAWVAWVVGCAVAFNPVEAMATTATAPPCGGGQTLVVGKGDSAANLLRRHGVSATQLANYLAKAPSAQRKALAHLHQGDQLQLCGGGDQPLARLDLQHRPLSPAAARRRAEQGGPDDVLPLVDDEHRLRLITVPAGTHLADALRQQRVQPKVAQAVQHVAQQRWHLGRHSQPGRLTLALGGSEAAPSLVYLERQQAGRRQRIYHYVDAKGHDFVLGDHGRGVRLMSVQVPLKYARVSSGWGWRRQPVLGGREFHHGIDYAAPKGTPVHAAMDGVVTMSGWHGNYGRLIEIRHADGVRTRYGHLSAFASTLRPGMHVHQGELIGYVGRSGLSTGPHLYFEIWDAGKRINPRQGLSVKTQLGELARQDFRQFVDRLGAPPAGA